MIIRKGDVTGQLDWLKEPMDEYFTVAEATKLLAMYGITDKESTVREWCSNAKNDDEDELGSRKRKSGKIKKKIHARKYEGGKRQEGYEIPKGELESFIKEWFMYHDPMSITKQYLDLILEYEKEIKDLKRQLGAKDKEKETEIKYILDNFVAPKKREKYLAEKQVKLEQDKEQPQPVEANQGQPVDQTEEQPQPAEQKA